MRNHEWRQVWLIFGCRKKIWKLPDGKKSAAPERPTRSNWGSSGYVSGGFWRKRGRWSRKSCWDWRSKPRMNWRGMLVLFCTALLLESDLENVWVGKIVSRQGAVRWNLAENRAKMKRCLLRFDGFANWKAKLHWGRARSCQAQSFVCFVGSGNSALVHGSARQLLGARKQTKNRARLLLAASQCRLAFRRNKRSLWLCCLYSNSQMVVTKARSAGVIRGRRPQNLFVCSQILLCPENFLLKHLCPLKMLFSPKPLNLATGLCNLIVRCDFMLSKVLV